MPDGLNRYSSVGVTLGCDGRGNLTSHAGSTYTYSAENRLLSASGATAATLSYDAHGRLAQLTDSATRRFLYDGSAIIAEYDGANVLQRRYVHGDRADEPLVWYEGAGTTVRRWLAADERGSVISVTNASGATVGLNTYDEYGNPGINNIGRFQYTGQAWLPSLKLHHYKARAYSPVLGRFLQTDPVGYADDVNLYLYARNDPLNLIDPSGKNPAAGCAVGAVAGPVGCAAGALVGTAVLAGVILSVPSDSQQVPSDAPAASPDAKPTDSASNGPKAADQPGAGSPAPTAGTNPSNTNPYSGPVNEPVTVVDSNGNAIPVSEGEQISTSPNGDYQQVRDKAGTPTGVRLDRGGHRGHSDPAAKGPHGHVPGVTQPNGNPHLPIKCTNPVGGC